MNTPDEQGGPWDWNKIEEHQKKLQTNQERVPTSERLAAALREAGAPAAMIERAEQGIYDDYKGGLYTPQQQLIRDAELLGLEAIAIRARQDEWQAQPWESEQWARSPAGHEMLNLMMHGPGLKRPSLAMQYIRESKTARAKKKHKKSRSR